MKAKRYIRTNVTNVRTENDQGIELEFVCRDSQNASPIKYLNGIAATIRTTPIHENSTSNDVEIDAFCGFNVLEEGEATMNHRKLFEKAGVYFRKSSSMNNIIGSSEESVQNNTENKKIDSTEKTLSKTLRKRTNCDITNCTSINESDIILANVFISDSSRTGMN